MHVEGVFLCFGEPTRVNLLRHSFVSRILPSRAHGGLVQFELLCGWTCSLLKQGQLRQKGIFVSMEHWNDLKTRITSAGADKHALWSGRGGLLTRLHMFSCDLIHLMNGFVYSQIKQGLAKGTRCIIEVLGYFGPSNHVYWAQKCATWSDGGRLVDWAAWWFIWLDLSFGCLYLLPELAEPKQMQPGMCMRCLGAL